MVYSTVTLYTSGDRNRGLSGLPVIIRFISGYGNTKKLKLILFNVLAINWRCWRKVCGYIITTNKFDVHDDNARVLVTKQPTRHSHDSDDDMIHGDGFSEAVKQLVRDDPSRPIKQAYDSTAASVSRGGYLRLNRRSIPEFRHIGTSVGRAKREELPRIP